MTTNRGRTQGCDNRGAMATDQGRDGETNGSLPALHDADRGAESKDLIGEERKGEGRQQGRTKSISNP